MTFDIFNDFLKKDKYGNDKENSFNKNDTNNSYTTEKMWTRPLHKDAFNLVIK